LFSLSAKRIFRFDEFIVPQKHEHFYSAVSVIADLNPSFRKIKKYGAKSKGLELRQIV